MGKAKLTNTFINIVRKNESDKKRGFGRDRNSFAGISNVRSISVGAKGGSAVTAETNEAFLRTEGDSMIGFLSFQPVEITLVGGVLVMNTGSSKIIVKSETAGADDLDSLSNVITDGQFVILQAETANAITLKHGTGNIQIPGGADLVLAVNESAILQFDKQGAGQYRVIANFKTGGGGADNLGDHTATTDLKMATNDILNIGQLVAASGATSDVGDAATGFDAGWFRRIEFPNTLGSILPSNRQIKSTQVSAVNTIVVNLPTNEDFMIIEQGGTTTPAFHLDTGGGFLNLDNPILGFRINASSALTISKPDGLAAAFTSTNGFTFSANTKITTGGFDVVTGDMDIEDGDFSIYDSGAQNSRIIMKYGASAFVDQVIRSNTSGIDVTVSSGNRFRVTVAGTAIMDVVDLGVGIKDGGYLQPAFTSNDTIGIVPFRSITVQTTIGSRGTILLPQSDLAIGSQTAANLDTRFGNGEAAVGATFDVAVSTGSGRHRIWMKNAGEWRGVEFTLTSV